MTVAGIGHGKILKIDRKCPVTMDEQGEGKSEGADETGLG